MGGLLSITSERLQLSSVGISKSPYQGGGGQAAVEYPCSGRMNIPLARSPTARGSLDIFAFNRGQFGDLPHKPTIAAKYAAIVATSRRLALRLARRLDAQGASSTESITPTTAMSIGENGFPTEVMADQPS